MKLLLLGNSEIARRRVVPVLAELGFHELAVASRTRAAQLAVPPGVVARLYTDYETALAESRPDLVYVSTTNNEHARWAAAALERGFHVVVDKPACSAVEDAERIVNLARKNKRCVAEATVFACHPQIALAKQQFAQRDVAPQQLAAFFTMPPLPADNFRNREDLGGGALLDLGPYAVVPGRLFFGEEPQEVCCRITGRGPQVESAFSVLATYSRGRSLVGHFGFRSGYVNRLEILAPRVSLVVNRVFSTPPELENELHVRDDGDTQVRVPAADSFVLFFRQVIQAIQTGDHDRFAGNLLSDARVLAALRRSAHAPAAAVPV